jgi:3'(2'), 5'-bisphosphate nucleotidase
LNKDYLQNIAETLLDTFFKAGDVAKEIAHKGVKISIKADNSPVTNGDLAVDKILREKISKLTPEIPIISEETVNLEEKNRDTIFWLIDPIDGTKDYIKKKDEYTLNAALIIDLKPAIGIVYAPEKKRLFYSYGKSFSYELNNNRKKRVLNCKKKTEQGKIFAVVNSSSPSEDILQILKDHKVKNNTKIGSSYKFCVIAAGEFDIYAAKARAYEWDIAAGHAVLEHAGGIVTTLTGKKFLYGKHNYKNLPLLIKRSNTLEK